MFFLVIRRIPKQRGNLFIPFFFATDAKYVYLLRASDSPEKAFLKFFPSLFLHIYFPCYSPFLLLSKETAFPFISYYNTVSLY